MEMLEHHHYLETEELRELLVIREQGDNSYEPYRV